MKHICIVATNLKEYNILTPLMKQIQKDAALILTVVSTASHEDKNMIITSRRLEEEGLVADEETHVVFKPDAPHLKTEPIVFEQMGYEKLFKQLQPDIIVLFGNRHESLSAAIAASLHDIPVAHVQGGESEYRTWEDSYGYGITKLSHLHFTSTEKYKKRVIRFGEHPDRVFNVGSLLVERAKKRPLREKDRFYKKTGLKKTPFLFISFQPDQTLGSKNGKVFENLLKTLNNDSMKKFQLLFHIAGEKGLGKMISHMAKEFCDQNSDRAVCCSDMDFFDLSHAIRYGLAVIGNTPETSMLASSFKKPVINVGSLQQDRMKSSNMIDCDTDSQEILHAIENGLSAQFNLMIQLIGSPFEKANTANKIKEILKSYKPSDISMKAYFTG